MKIKTSELIEGPLEQLGRVPAKLGDEVELPDELVQS